MTPDAVKSSTPLTSPKRLSFRKRVVSALFNKDAVPVVHSESEHSSDPGATPLTPLSARWDALVSRWVSRRDSSASEDSHLTQEAVKNGFFKRNFPRLVHHQHHGQKPHGMEEVAITEQRRGSLASIFQIAPRHPHTSSSSASSKPSSHHSNRSMTRFHHPSFATRKDSMLSREWQDRDVTCEIFDFTTDEMERREMYNKGAQGRRWSVALMAARR